MDLNSIEKEASASMHKAVDYLKSELKGVRTGRATPALIEFVKGEAYGPEGAWRSLGMVQAPEPTQLRVKPFDPGTVQDIIKGIEKAGLGLNPQADGKQVRISIPPLTEERRRELVKVVRELAENALGEWRVLLAGAAANKQLEVALGAGDVNRRINRFLGYYRSVSNAQQATMRYVDTRYPNGIAVRHAIEEAGGLLAETTVPVMTKAREDKSEVYGGN